LISSFAIEEEEEGGGGGGGGGVGESRNGRRKMSVEEWRRIFSCWVGSGGKCLRELSGNEGDRWVLQLGYVLEGLEGLCLWETEAGSLSLEVENPEGRD